MNLGERIHTALGELLRRRRRTLLLRRMPRGAVCAEIGVWKGDFTERILDITRPRELHLVDAWRFDARADQWHGPRRAPDQEFMNDLFRKVEARFAERPEVEVHRSDSRSCARLFPEASLDWVYIDGDHSYDAVLSDLQSILDRVKTGGYIAGDDLLWGRERGYPVLMAVTEFVRREDVELLHASKDQYVLRRKL